MRKLYLALAPFALMFGMMLLNPVSGWSQCNTAPAAGPINYTINMSGQQAIIDAVALAGVVNPVDDLAPCNMCELAWATNPLGPYTLFSSMAFVVDCASSTFPLSLWVRSENGLGCESAPVEVVMDLNDTSVPTIICPAVPQVVNADANCQATVPGLVFMDVSPNDAALPLEYGDNCGTPAMTYSYSGATFGVGAGNDLSAIVFDFGITTVTVTVDDGVNTNSCMFTVEVEDNEDPTWTTPSTTPADYPGASAITSMVYDVGTNRLTVTLNCDDPNFTVANDHFTMVYEPVAEDNCDPNPTEIFHDQSDINPWVCPTISHIRRRWRAIDASGNDIDVPGPTLPLAKLDLIVEDNTSPDFTIVPQAVGMVLPPSNNQSFLADTLTLYVADFVPGDCEIDLTGSSLLEVTAEDCQMITYTWAIPSSLDPFGAPTALDGISSGPNDNNANLVFPLGVHEIEYYAEDECGLVSTYSFTLEIVDNVLPIIMNCPVDVVVNNVTDLCENTIIWELPTVSDNCMFSITRTDQAFDHAGLPINMVVFTPDSAFAIFPVGINEVLHIYEDGLGNIDTCLFTVTILDAQAPEITCGGDLTLFSICGTAPLPSYLGNLATIDENCPGYTLAQYPTAGTLLNVIKSPNPVDGDTIHVSIIITDIGGNMDTCTFVVELIDDDAPIPTVGVLTPINPNTTLLTECGSYMLCAPTATDCNAGTLIYGTTSIAGATFDPNGCGPGIPGYLIHNPGNYSITWLYVAGNGKSTSQQQQVDIEADVTAPMLNCPADITVDTDPGICETSGIAGIGMSEIFPTATPYLQNVDLPLDGEVIDNCGVTDFEWSTSSGYSASTPAPNAWDAGTATFDIGLNTVTYTAGDAAGNTSSCQFTVTIEDNEDPSFTCPGTAGFLNATQLQTGSVGDANHNDCGYTLDNAFTSLDPSNLFDNCGATTLTYVMDLFGGATLFTAGPNPSSLAGSTFTVDPSIGQGSFRVTWTLTDGNNNTTTCIRWIRVFDDQDPTIQCPVSPLVRTTSQDGFLGDCQYTASGPEFDPVSTSDNCQVFGSLNNYNFFTSLDGANFPVGSTIVTWTVWDIQLNSSSCDIEIIVSDDEPPVNIYCPSDTVIVNLNGDCFNNYEWLRPTENSWTDNCDNQSDLTVTENISDPSVIPFPFLYDQTLGGVVFASFPVGVTTITYTATDLSNNSHECIFTVTVVDNEPPVITCGGDLELNSICGTAPLPNYMGNIAIVDENCPGYTLAQYPAPGTLLNVIKSPNPVDGDTIHVSLIITDQGGNMDTCTFVLTLVDDDAPIPTVDPLSPINPNTTLYTECGSYMLCAPTATDCNSGTTIYGTTSIAGATYDPNGCGPGSPGYLIHNPGNYSVTWLYVAGNGMSTVQQQQVDIESDVTAPTLNCPPNIIVDTDPGVCEASGIAGIGMVEIFPTMAPYLQGLDFPNDGQVIDNCGITLFGWSTTSGYAASTPDPNAWDAGTATFNEGLNTVTYTAADDAGNIGTCQFTVTVEDNEAPTFACPGLSGSNNAAQLFTGSLGDTDASDCAYTLDNMDTSLDPTMLDDNCGAVSLTYVVQNFLGGLSFSPGPNPSSLAGSTFTIAPALSEGLFQVTWTLTDGSNNTTTCIRWVNVIDGQNPTIVCPQSPLVRTTSQDGILGDCYYTTSGTEFDPLSTADNCQVFNWSNDYNFSTSLDSASFHGGSTFVTWTVWDVQLNSSSCVIEIIVEDDEPPVNIYCPSDTILPNLNGDCFNNYEWLRPSENSWTDNCDLSSDLTVTEHISDPTVFLFPAFYDQTTGGQVFASFPVGVTTITYTATDLSNNTHQCIFTVTIEDLEPPTINCPQDITLGTTCLQGTVPDYTNLAIVSDNCSASFSVTQTPAPGTTLATVFSPNAPMNGDVFVVTLTATDQNTPFFSSDCTFNVTLEETNLPQPNMIPLALLLDSCAVIDVQAPTANDCGNLIYGVPSAGVLIQLNPPVYRYTTGLYNVIWTYIGASGNSFQGQSIEVKNDNTAPNTQCQALIRNLSSMNPGSVTLTALDFDAGSTDYCGIVDWDFSVNGGSFLNTQSFGCADVGVNTIVLRTTDAAGNQSTCQTTLTINDNTNPTIVGGCPLPFAVNTSNNLGYDCEALATIIVPNVTDNCNIAIYELNLTLPGGAMLSLGALNTPVIAQVLPKGVTAATFFVVDEHGNAASCNFTITVIDDEDPQIVCPSDQTRSNDPLECHYTAVGSEFDPVSFIDNCPGSFAFNDYNGLSTLDNAVFPVGAHTVVWTVVDAVGHTALCSFTIEVEDNEPPQVLWCQPNVVQTATQGTCNALVSWSPTYGIVGDVDDNCGIFNITESISDPTVIPVYPYLPFGPFPPFLLNQALFPVGTTTVTYTVEDIHGNTAQCVFTVDIIDDQAPSITCPPNQTLSTICASGTVPDYTGLISNLADNCVGNLIINQSPLAGTPLANVPGLTPLDGESFTVTITATDPNPFFLSASCNFTVTLDDVNLPIPDQANLPTLFSDCESIIVSPPTANDCGNVIVGIPDKGMQISFAPPLYQFDIGLYTVIWTYVGVNGSVQQVQQIQVGPDSIPPTVSCVNATVILNANGNGTLSPGAVTGNVFDNCSIAGTSVNPSQFNCSNVGVNIVTLTATDIFGNTATCLASVLVQDLTAPTFSIPTNSSVTANCQSVPPLPNVIASDACGVATLVLNESSTKGGNANNCNFYTYSITRIWTATDVNGNVATAQQVINVQDVAPPVWTAAMPDMLMASTNPFNCTGGIVFNVTPAMISDNCAGFNNLSITYVGSNNTSGTTNASGQYPLGTTTLTFTAVDPCGNVSVKVVTIVVKDETLPTPVCINSITLPLNPQGLLVIPPQIVDNGSYDNCLTPFSPSDISLSVFPDTFDCDDAGMSFVVVLTVTDLAGNTATCPAIINIIDNTQPVFVSCAPDVTVSCTADISPAALGEPTFTDNCGVFLTFTDNTVPIGGAICYRIDRNWVADDGYGNITLCQQRISVFDNSVPTFVSNLPANVTIECSPIPTAPVILATDNCGPTTVNFQQTSTKTTNLTCTDYDYTITRTWTATDGCQNSVVHNQILTINDNTAPVISGLPDTVILFTNDFNADSCTVPVVLVAQVDDCQPDSVITVTNNGPFGPGTSVASGSYPAGVYNIAFNATDRCGNASGDVVHLRVIDNSTPVAACFTNINVSLNSQGFAIVTPGQVNDQSHDNCTSPQNLLLELSQDTFDCSNLGQNMVTLTVTDAAGNTNQCVSTVNVTTGPGNQINHTVNVVFETFPGASDGSISIVASGGSGMFTYLWTPGGQTTPSRSGLVSGTYTLVITDVITGCQKTIMVFVGILGVPDIVISGKIFTPTGLPVGKVHVNMTGSQSGSYYTLADGYYEFTVPAGSTVTITPFKDTLPANGVTSLDFAVIQQHILAPPGLKPLTTPFKLIAADENGNNAINGIDIAQFQNTILNNFPNFPNVTSWVFVQEGYVFPNPLAPWSMAWPMSTTFTNIGANAPNTNFTGVKMGDVTDDVNPTTFTTVPEADTRSSKDAILVLTDRALVEGDHLMIPVKVGAFEDIKAFQFTWQFDAEVLEFKGMKPGLLQGFSPTNLSDQRIADGLIPNLWYNREAISLEEGTEAFYLEFVVKQPRASLEGVLDIRQDYLGQIAYDGQHEMRQIELRYEDSFTNPTGVEDAKFFLVGNRPNPFSYMTQIEYVLPEALPVHLTITDLSGRAVARFQADGAPGQNIMVVNQDHLPGPGMYLYILQAGEHRALGKMHFQD